MSKFQVVFTGDVTDEVHASEGATRANGWVCPEWSMTALFEEKEEVATYDFDTREEAEAFIEDTIGATETSDGEAFYSTDSNMDMTTGDYWSYCGHVSEI